MKDYSISDKILLFLLKKAVMLLGHILQLIDEWDLFLTFHAFFLLGLLLHFQFFIREVKLNQQMLHFHFRF